MSTLRDHAAWRAWIISGSNPLSGVDAFIQGHVRPGDGRAGVHAGGQGRQRGNLQAPRGGSASPPRRSLLRSRKWNKKAGEDGARLIRPIAFQSPGMEPPLAARETRAARAPYTRGGEQLKRGEGSRRRLAGCRPAPPVASARCIKSPGACFRQVPSRKASIFGP